jgi:hypothetical protein
MLDTFRLEHYPLALFRVKLTLHRGARILGPGGSNTVPGARGANQDPGLEILRYLIKMLIYWRDLR